MEGGLSLSKLLVSFLSEYILTLLALRLEHMDSFLRGSSCAQPLSLADKVHELVGNQKDNQKIQSLTRPHLDRLQMSWEADVEDVYPIIGTLSFFFMKDFPNLHKRVYTTSLTDPN